MDYEFSDDLMALREDLRNRIRTAFPDGFPTVHEGNPEWLEASHRFCESLSRDSLLTVAWPDEYGGEEASPWAQLVVAEEMWAHGEPRGGQYQGVNWVGPAIMRFGTEEQKALFLPLIAEGEGFWCQGLSEPEAGSDLAALRLSAKAAEGGGWVLNGQKIWTSYADYAKWCFLAARTDPSGSRHDGITVFLIPMDRPGIDVRPIPNIAGEHDLNEVFFEDVRAEPADVLGTVGEGWSVLMTSLGLERIGSARYMRSERLLSEARAYLQESDHSTHSQRLGWVESAVRTRVARLLSYRTVAAKEEDSGTAISPLHSSVARVANTLNDQLTTTTLLDILAPDSLLGVSESEKMLMGGDLEREWRYALMATVGGGTVDIQRIVIAREVLGNPPR